MGIKATAILSALITLLSGFAAFSQDSYLFVETTKVGPECYASPDCVTGQGESAGHVLRMPTESVDAFLDILTQNAFRSGISRSTDAAFCERPNISAIQNRPSLDNIMALRGLTQVRLEIGNVSGPDGRSDTFGALLEDDVRQALADAGLEPVLPDDAKDASNLPTLVFSFSPSRENHGCFIPFRASARLTQSVVLARDLDIKIDIGTWSHSVSESLATSFVTPEIAMMDVARKFVSDFLAANS